MVASLSLRTDSVDLLSFGDTTSLVPITKDAGDNDTPRPLIRWTSSAPHVVTVNDNGLVEARSEGTAVVTAATANLEAAATVHVYQAAAAVSITTGFDTLRTLSDTIALSTVTRDRRGHVIPAPRLRWTSHDPMVATADSVGRIASVGDGTARIAVAASTPRHPTRTAISNFVVHVNQATVLIRWDSIPSNVLEGRPLVGVRFRLTDARGGTVAKASGSASVSLEPGSGPGTLGGPTTLQIVNGVGDLSMNSIDRPGATYRLVASWPPIGAVTSPPFGVYQRFQWLEVGGAFSCARDFGNATWCWGSNHFGQFLVDSLTGSSIPLRTPALDRFDRVFVGASLGCGVDDGAISCWGNIASPTLVIPTLVPGGSGLSGIASNATESYGCGLRSGAVLCWGQFGPGGPFAATAVPGPAGLGFQAIGPGSAHICALALTGHAYCRGDNKYGTVGDGTATFRPMFTAVAGGRQYTTIEGGIVHTCAIDLAGQLYCWGDNLSGQLADLGIGSGSLVPIRIPTPVRLTTLSLGAGHGCGVGVDGNAYCWGRSQSGELGAGLDRLGDPRVHRVTLPDPVTRVGAGQFFSCALTVPGQVYCWGENLAGQRGDGGNGVPWDPSPVRPR